jgi:hypothetical protein
VTRGARSLTAVLVLVLALAGCESSQDRSARLAKKGIKVFQQKGLQVTHRSADVKVVQATVLHDANGTAVVVKLHNSSPIGLAHVPISINVKTPSGSTLFKNDQPGLEDSLVSAPVIAPRADEVWVNDQVLANGTPKSVTALVGTTTRTLRTSLPKLQVSKATLAVDPVSGVEANGSVTNRSAVEQRKLIITCVAEKGGRIVAAGRGEIPRLRVGQKSPYHVFFIGDPRGAQLSVAAPPTTLQ